MPAGGFLGFLLRLLRQESRRSHLIARRRHGAGGLRRHNRHVQRLRHLGGRRQVFRRNERHRYGFRWYGGRCHGPRRGRGGGDGAGPSNAQAVPSTSAPLVMPEAQPLPAWILAGPAAPNLYADEEMEPADDDVDVDDPALAAPPPPLPCPVHGWACPRLAQQGIHVEEEAEPEVPAASPDLPSPTPAHELATAEPAQSRLDPPLHPPFWCPVHGWVVCPLHQYDFAIHDAPLQPPTRAVVEAEAGAPLPRSPTVERAPDAPLVQVRDGDALAFVSAPTGASVFAFGSGVNGSSNHAVVDVDAVAPRLPSPTPATPPPSPPTGARRRLRALGAPLVSSPSSHRYGTWNPAALGLTNGVANGVSNGVASSHGLLGGSSSEEDDGAPGPSARRR